MSKFVPKDYHKTIPIASYRPIYMDQKCQFRLASGPEGPRIYKNKVLYWYRFQISLDKLGILE